MRVRAAVVATLVLGAGSCTAASPDGPRSASPTAAPAVDTAAFAPSVTLGVLVDDTLVESSGLAASRRNPGLLWTHNDSGDDPKLYCLTRAAARCGTWRVTGAQAIDWEDMAAGPGPTAGENYLYIGDIGDNAESRSGIEVYRFVEPSAPAAGVDEARTAPADILQLRYQDGPHNAEALLVHPVTGDLYVVTKDARRAGVYKARPGADVLKRIADFPIGQSEVVTGGDIAPDGRRAVVCTYIAAYELALPSGAASFDDIWVQPRHRVALGARVQGEAIAYRVDGAALLTTSERTPMPLDEVARR